MRSSSPDTSWSVCGRIRSPWDSASSGRSIPGIETFLDQEVEWLYTLNSALSPPGVVLQVNQFRGCMNLILTYISEAVPETLAESFLDTIMEDLLA